jgi:hypothetical protein
VRLESTSELRRRYGWGGWGRRSTRGGGRRWPGNSGDGGLEWSGGSSTVTVGRGVIGFSSGLMARGKVHDWWLHVRHVERKWRLVGSVGCEVAGDRAAVTRAGPVSGRRLEALHKGGGCMCGAWKLGGRWQVAAVGGDDDLAMGGHDRTLFEYASGAIGLSGQYCSTEPGPIRCTMLFFQLFKLCSNFKIQNEDNPDVQNIETWHGVIVDHSKQLLPLGPLPIPNKIQVIKLEQTPL